MTEAICVLTRGYIEYNKYKNLISRNKSVSKHLKNKNIDVIIFHEGNINENHQDKLMKETPDLNIKFVNVSSVFKSKLICKTNDFNRQLGYINMCSFWSGEFLSFVSNYTKIIRLDEDCMIGSNIDKIFEILDEKIFYSAKIIKERKVRDLNRIVHKFVLDNGKTDSLYTNVCYGPYTNFMAINLEKIRQNILFMKFINFLKETELVHTHAFGDLAIWGTILHYILDSSDYHTSKRFNDYRMHYSHASHNYFC